MSASVSVCTPENGIGSPIPLRFVIAETRSNPCDIVCEYEFQGGAYQTATPAARSDSQSGLPAPACGIPYRFLWDAAKDLGSGTTGTATFRITPRVNGVAGAAAATAPFQVDTTAEPAPLAFAAPVPRLVSSIVHRDGGHSGGICFDHDKSESLRDGVQVQ
jgi:hypothetical protein